MADMDIGGGVEAAPVGPPGAFSTLVNWTGAAMSVALIGGLAVWGYQLAMRDVTGVPVVLALEGPMRVAPDNPGGERAAHQGLAVNSVAADGGAAAPADRLILAPAPLDLTVEDLPRPQLAEVPEAVPAPGGPANVLALADQLAEGVTPLSATLTQTVTDIPIASETGIKIIPASVRGVSRSPLPSPRPVDDMTANAVASAVALASAGPAAEINPGEISVGTRLVQFGAYDSPEAARAEWGKLEIKFSDFLRDKTRVVQEAVSGGKTFWRLRAMGFADINDARRFCSALLAERQACIPVVVR